MDTDGGRNHKAKRWRQKYKKSANAWGQTNEDGKWQMANGKIEVQ
jgi:hypothetical protein